MKIKAQQIDTKRLLYDILIELGDSKGNLEVVLKRHNLKGDLKQKIHKVYKELQSVHDELGKAVGLDLSHKNQIRRAASVTAFTKPLHPSEYFDMQDMQKNAQIAYNEVLKNFTDYQEPGTDTALHFILTLAPGHLKKNTAFKLIDDYDILPQDERAAVETNPDEYWGEIDGFFDALCNELKKIIKIEGDWGWDFITYNNDSDGSYELGLMMKKGNPA